MRTKPVVYLTKQRAARLDINLDKDAHACAGPRANVTGMRRIWGSDACIVRQGRYIYRVPVWIWRAAAGQTDANPPGGY